MGEPPITQEALDRMEGTARRELIALKDLLEARLVEIERRLADLNNSHEKATTEKQRTDSTAQQVQERAVTRMEFQSFKDDQLRALALQEGAAFARAESAKKEAVSTARAWSFAAAIGVLLANLAIRYFTPRGP